MLKRPLSALLTLGLAAAAAPSVAQNSQISLDGSLPHGRTDVLTGPGTGPEYVVSEDLGWRSGSNLFHSFLRFDVASGETARFTSDTTLPPLSNVIARVTGGDASDIDGTLRTRDIPTANFYLLNPAGVLFGGASAIDVPKSLYVSTAHQLSFANGDVLDLENASAPTLSVAAVESFGFKGGVPAGDVVFSNPDPGQSTVRQFAVGDGETFSASGGDVLVDNRMRLLARGGRVQLVATGSAAIDVPVDAAHIPPQDALSETLGEVIVRNGGELVASSSNRSAPQGTIVIRGGRFALESGSVMRAGAVRADGGPSFDVAASRVEISGESLLQATAPGPNPSGGLAIAAVELNVRDGAVVRTRADSTADAGELRVEARTVHVRDGGLLSSFNQGKAGGGRVVLQADSLDLDGGAEIQSINSSTGRGGDIHIEVGELSVVDSGINAESGSFGPGGSIEIDADRVEVRGGLAQISALNQVAAAPGPIIPGGEIRIGSAERPAGSVLVAGGGLVSTETSGAQPGGAIHVFADSLEVAGGVVGEKGELHPSALQTATLSELESGAAGSIFLRLGTLRVGASETSDVPGIVAAFVAEGARGAGGSIELEAGSVLLEDGGQVSTTTFGAGHAGSIDVDLTGDFVARGARLAGGFRPSGLFARGEAGSSGDAGSISVSAPRIELLDSAAISSRADGSGNSGNIELLATQAIRIVGSFQASSVTARGLAGRAGNVTLAGPEVDGELRSVGLVELRDGGIVDVSVSGAGEAGLLRVVADELRISGESGTGIPSSLGAETAGPGDASGIDVEVSGLVRVEQGGELNAISRSSGAAGGIHIEAGSIEVVDGGKLRVESEASGPAGSVVLEAESDVRIERAGELSAISNASGAAGNIEVTARKIVVADGGKVTAESKGQAAAGSVTLTARPGSIRIRGGGELTVRSAAGQRQDAGTLRLDSPDIEVHDSKLTADADRFGGNIEIARTDFVLLEKAQLEATSRGVPVDEEEAAADGTGALAAAADTPAGGNIRVDGGAVVLNQARLVANGFGNANGGFIDISADPWLRSGDSVIRASSEFGLDGVVLINTPYGEVTSELAALPETFLDASSLLEEPCLARDAPSGSFAVQRAPHVPPPPDAPLSAEPAEPQQCEAPPAP